MYFFVFAGLTAIITSILTLGGLHITILHCSSYVSLSNILLLYLSGITIRILSSIRYNRLIQQTKDIATVQEKFLINRLKMHQKTDYGKRHKFAELSNSTEYRTRHPLTRYVHFEEYIEKVANGDTNALLVKKPIGLALSSGTTGKSKMIPRSSEQKTYFFLKGFILVLHAIEKMEQAAGLTTWLQKGCVIYVDPVSSLSPAGIPMSLASKCYESDRKLYSMMFSTPASGFKIANEQSAYYVHACFALRDRNLASLQGYYSSVVYGFMRLIESQWKSLVDDIKFGTLNSKLDIPDDVRQDLQKYLIPDPERASELKQEFQKGFKGIVKRVWPFYSYTMATTSGSFAVYADILRDTYCRGKIQNTFT